MLDSATECFNPFLVKALVEGYRGNMALNAATYQHTWKVSHGPNDGVPMATIFSMTRGSNHQSMLV